MSANWIIWSTMALASAIFILYMWLTFPTLGHIHLPFTLAILATNTAGFFFTRWVESD